MPATSEFLQPWLEPLIGRWLYADSPLWTVVGFLGAGIFGSRFVLQWLQTEKEKKLVVPWHFWHLSFWGSLLNLVYFMHLDKAPLILGNCFLPFLYGRNILFLRQDGERGRGRKVFACVALLALLGFGWSRFFGKDGLPSSEDLRHSPESRAKRDMSTLLIGLRGYSSEYKGRPDGNNDRIFRQLRSENPRGIRFIDVPPAERSPEGAWLDPWGTPYRIYVSEGSWLVRSAGGNGRFDEGLSEPQDDILMESKIR